MKLFVLISLFILCSPANARDCSKWEYGILYLSYTHDGDAKQQWETGGKIYNWLEGEIKKPQHSESNDAAVSMKKHFDFDREIVSRPDNLDAIGNKGWELVSEKITPDNRATYYFKRCK